MTQTVFIEVVTSDEELLALKESAMMAQPYLRSDFDGNDNLRRANSDFFLAAQSAVPDIVDELIARRSPHNILNAIWQAIQNERRYQDRKWGTVHDHSHSVPGWLMIMEEELTEAKRAWVRNTGDAAALREILQVIAVGVACLEQYGVVERESNHDQKTV